MMVKSALCAGMLLLLSAPAHALCRDDLKDLKPRIDHARTASPQRYYLALKWWGRAQEAEPGSEVECLNFLAKARKALFGPLPEIAACDQPNTYLPACQNGGRINADTAIGPVGPIDMLGGGGGGVPFHPPGSVGGPDPGGEATGTDR
jgi:hypothetical protein